MTDRETLLAYRLKQAEETLADAQAMAESKLSPRSIVNRTYYAMFYAVLGLFLKAHRVAPVQGAGFWEQEPEARNQRRFFVPDSEKWRLSAGDFWSERVGKYWIDKRYRWLRIV